VDSVAGVDRICEDLFLSARARERDDNLLFVRDRILRSESDHAALLMLYDRVRKHDRLRDDPAHPLISILRLSGIIRVREGFLYVRNRIYFRVFDREWVRSNLPMDEIARQKAAYKQGVLRVARIATPVCLILIGLTIYAIHEKRVAKNLASQVVNQVLESDIDLYQQTSNDADLTAKLGPFWNETNTFFEQMAGQLGNAETVNVARAFSHMMSGYAYDMQAKKDKTAQAKALTDYLAGVKYAQAAKAQDPKSNRINVLAYVLYDEIGVIYQDQEDNKGPTEKKDYTNAINAYQQSLIAAQDLIKLHDNGSSEDDLGTADRHLGVMADDQNNPKKGLSYYQAAVAAARKAASDDTDYFDDLWTSFDDLASEQDVVVIGDYTGAQQTYTLELKDLGIAMGESTDAAVKTKLQAQVVQTYGNRAWSELLTKQYKESLADAQTSLKMDSKQDWMKVNLAHAYLFNGQLQQAENIYFPNANRKVGDSEQTYAEVALGDFATFRAMKMVAPGMDGVEQQLEKLKKSAPAAAPAAAPTPGAAPAASSK
jgi:hypothetical protein